MSFARLVICHVFILLWLAVPSTAGDWIVQSISQDITVGNDLNDNSNYNINNCIQLAEALANEIFIVQHMEQDAKLDNLDVLSVAIVDQNNQLFVESNVPENINTVLNDLQKRSDKLGIVFCGMNFPNIDKPNNEHNNPIKEDEGIRIIKDTAPYENIITILVEVRWDFGDLSDLAYHTLLASNGARHIIVPGFYLGQKIDAETDGHPSPNANGDDLNETHDEDGVVFASAIIPGDKAFLDVTASQPGILNAWMDFDGDGAWGGEGEKIFSDLYLDIGINQISFDVPARAPQGDAYSRFRFSSAKGLSFDGPALDGEVEDYRVQIAPP